MHRISAWAERRGAPVVATVAMLICGPAYVVGWGKLHHGGVWMTSPDLWDIARSSGAYAHAHFSHIYASHAALTSPPGLELLLAPLMALGSALGLHPPQFHVAGTPYLWSILGPAAILIGSTALFAIDAVARRWGYRDTKRMALALVGAVGVANVVVFWGHPEDCIAVALLIWGALQMEGGDEGRAHVSGTHVSGTHVSRTNFTRAGWLLGLAVAFQPLALLAVVPIFARIHRRSVPGLLLRLAAPSLIVLIPPLLADTSGTLSVLIHQPSYPNVVSSTPFSSLAPALAHGAVSGGPMRLLSTAMAVTISYLVCRRRHDLATVIGVTALSFSFRVVFETELTGYYFWPIAALCLVLAMRRSWAHFWVCGAASAAALGLGNHRVHHIEWWWPALMVATLVLLLSALPQLFGAIRSASEFSGLAQTRRRPAASASAPLT